jgi:gamma-glutamyltranspeptidase/glutathione hydrolase
MIKLRTGRSFFARTLVATLVLLLPLSLFAEGGRTPLRVQNGIVTSASRLASDVGVDIL